jgi:hypothetical protein
MRLQLRSDTLTMPGNLLLQRKTCDDAASSAFRLGIPTT